MKRFLFSLVAILFTCICFAQDVIIKKDGTTILSTVIKVGQSEVEYKKYNNQSVVTTETATQFSNDEGLLKLYDAHDRKLKKAKRIKSLGCIVGGTLLAAGGALIISSVSDDDIVIIGSAVAGAGLITWTTCTLVGNHIAKKSKYSVQSNPLFQQEYKIGKNSLAFGVDMLNDNTFKNQTLGLGVSYKF